MRLSDLTLRALPIVIGTAAVATIVHVGAILAYPGHVTDDAFTRVARLAPVDVRTDFPTAEGAILPFQDPAMTAVVCRYDLSRSPFTVKINGLDQGMLSLGMHSRRGTPFYGLNLFGGADRHALTLLLMTERQTAQADALSSQAEPHALRIAAPEPEGFVLIEAPNDGPGSGRAALAHVGCSSATAPVGASDPEAR